MLRCVNEFNLRLFLLSLIMLYRRIVVWRLLLLIVKHAAIAMTIWAVWTLLMVTITTWNSLFSMVRFSILIMLLAWLLLLTTLITLFLTLFLALLLTRYLKPLLQSLDVDQCFCSRGSLCLLRFFVFIVVITRSSLFFLALFFIFTRFLFLNRCM
ncbi:hypothetical protein WU86_09135 [Corynebacterium xerosis]|nr:hypothetical protein WU86_09135 [Corynebacterium xerosis]